MCTSGIIYGDPLHCYRFERSAPSLTGGQNEGKLKVPSIHRDFETRCSNYVCYNYKGDSSYCIYINDRTVRPKPKSHNRIHPKYERPCSQVVVSLLRQVGWEKLSFPSRVSRGLLSLHGLVDKGQRTNLQLLPLSVCRLTPPCRPSD